MSEAEQGLGNIPSVHDAAESRKVVVKEDRKPWVEITCAVVLALATTASAWCAYQSQLWGGVQIFRLAAAGKAGRESTENTIAALQYRMFDALMLIKYTEIRAQGNKQMEKFLYDRFRPEMKKAVEAWLKTDPFSDPAAPHSPFEMPEYVQKQQEESKAQDAIAAEMATAADLANQNSDTYLLLTVIFASVLFFGGISGTFESRQLQTAMGVMALLLFSATMIALATMPICQE